MCPNYPSSLTHHNFRCQYLLSRPLTNVFHTAQCSRLETLHKQAPLIRCQRLNSTGICLRVMGETRRDTQRKTKWKSWGNETNRRGERERSLSVCFTLLNPRRLLASRFTAHLGSVFPLDCPSVHLFPYQTGIRMERWMEDDKGGGVKGGQLFLASLERNEDFLHLKADIKTTKAQGWNRSLCLRHKPVALH